MLRAPAVLVKPRGDVDLADYAIYIKHVAGQNPGSTIHAITPGAGDPVNNILKESRFYLVLKRFFKTRPGNLILYIVPIGALVEEWFDLVRFSYWLQYKIVYYNYAGRFNTGFAIPCSPLPLGRGPINCRVHQLECVKSLRAFVNRVHSELGTGVPILPLNCPERVLQATRVFDLTAFLSGRPTLAPRV